MNRLVSGLTGVFLTLVLGSVATFSQAAGSISGTVIDANGAVVPNASVVAKGEGGQEFTVVTNDIGVYRIPAVPNGVYRVTITAINFKTSIIENVKVDVGTPSTVDTTLEVGRIDESVVVASGGEVLQTQTATVGTNIIGRQITETPIASRDALDLVGLLPGTASVGRPRASSINGLPKGAISITIDGVDVQANDARSADGYFTYVRPRVDAIDEVTVSTAAPGAESSGDGAVTIRFVTRRGTNDYNGGAFWQHRNDALNANYWYQNRDGARDENGKAFRQKVRLNQFGARYGGPLPFPHFGEGGPIFHSGKDKAFFFVNYEQFRQPEAIARNRTILTPEAQAGQFSYLVGGQKRTVDLYDIARKASIAQIDTPDPTVLGLLSDIRARTAGEGNISAISNDPNRLRYTWTPTGGDVRKFLATRFDFNVHKNHSIEFVMNRQRFEPSIDFLNGQESRFPGLPGYGQGSRRNSYTGAVRSTLTNSLINEARYTQTEGYSEFGAGISGDVFANQRGFALGIDAAGITTPIPRNSYTGETSPVWDITDSVSWIKGNHSFSFGGQFKRIKRISNNINRVVPSVGFGLNTNDAIAFNMFSTTTLADASPAQITEARALYATLVGRVLSYTNTVYLVGDGTYQQSQAQARKSDQDTYGLYAQDSWKIRPNLTVNYGLRWQPQGAYRMLTENFARMSSFDDLWGVSGPGNIFKPGTLTGKVPTVVAMEVGETAYPTDLNNFGPSVGLVWSPNFEKGFWAGLFGGAGKSVFRGGYSRAFVREGTDLVASILQANPGGSIAVSRGVNTFGSLQLGTNLRDPNNPNLTPFYPTGYTGSANYPLTPASGDGTNTFDPSLQTGKVDSYTFGYQRELDRNTVIEFRYVGNRGRDLFRQHNLNEINVVENKFIDEWRLAQGNLYANEAAFAAGDVTRRACPGFVRQGNVCTVSSSNAGLLARVPTYAYFGGNSGTNQLPIMLSYFNGAATFDPTNPARYSSTLFFNATLVNQLSVNASSATGFAANVENDATRRQNALNNGRPSNFFIVNPTTRGGAFVVDNSAVTWYDSGVIEIRRRLSAGLRVAGSYVWAKAQSDSFQSNLDNFANFSHREGGRELAKNVAVFDVRHNIKFDATYDLPFGKGRAFFSGSKWLVDGFLGGWSIMPVVRWHSGSPITLGNVQLVGMTKKELQKAVGVYKDSVVNGVNVVTWLPLDIIQNTQRAFNIDVSRTGNGGYGIQFGEGGPQGRFIAPAGFGNCQQTRTGDCGFTNLIIYGPDFFKFDVGLAKKINFGERLNMELRATFLDALNAPSFRVGGWGADTAGSGTVGSAAWGQMGPGSAYQDLSTTNDPGGRLIDLMLRINF